ncbi:DUF3592 domain-containing protein [Myxococcus sp. MISCRS1]|uniref:DUF3592 domain-containing protein n=1 Tax=Myxococcus sp. MISCRS1 TaxID=2996786 RepID=UPI002271C901|nr:DUF3592 domain-containing protein [Myxococcus sp. MISCRS1]MCY0996746.1 DUF3592 domain-containing protein [Myxococcus sp. MISCRS1]
MMKGLMMGLMLLFGVMLAYGGGRLLYRAHASEQWPTTEGTVVSSSVQTMHDRRNTRFHPEVRYEYTVGGSHYTSDTVSFGGNDTGALPDAQRLTRRYASGTKMAVHYAPDDPAIACVECGGAGVSSYVVMFGGLAVAGVAGTSMVDMISADARERRRNKGRQLSA